MIDFNRKPNPKSEAEKAFDELNEQYFEKFGTDYVFAIGIDSMTWEEATADIKRRIAENDPQPEPDYKPGNVY